MKLRRRVDRPGLLRVGHGFAGLIHDLVAVLGAPLADGVEVLQSEADRIDLAVAARALRLLLVGEKALARREDLARETSDLGDVGRRGRRRIVKELAQDPGASLDRAGVVAVPPHEADRRHP